MKLSITVAAQLPVPARNLLQVVQSAAKIKNHPAQKAIRGGSVLVNGKVCLQANHRLQIGDRVEIDLVRLDESQPKAKNSSRASRNVRDGMQVEYEDSDIIVVQKPAHLLTVPTQKRERNTLIHQVSKYVDRNARRIDATKSLRQNRSDGFAQGGSRPMFSVCCVHRLDRGVSGLLVFAKSLEAAEKLRSQFAAKKPDRKYIAIVHGNLRPVRGTFQSRLATDEQLNCYSSDDPDLPLAITHYRVSAESEHIGFVEVRLETGKRNQIRVHLSEAGHPILGDPRYGNKESTIWPFKRLALHAESLGFKHPESNERMQFHAPWPESFRQLHRKCKPISNS